MHVLFILIYFRSSVVIMQVRKGLQKAPRSPRPSSPPLALHQRGEKIMSFKDGVSKNMRLCDAEEALACSPFHPPTPPRPAHRTPDAGLCEVRHCPVTH